ncbi:MAG TPA: glycosyltransferase family 4 protein, partial [Hyphomicrobiaceae bacterium]|nr:glycosyltransferase family 4 protein [Hyphomicrobiaceae bacterium]
LKCTVVGNIKQRVGWNGIDPRGIELTGPVEHLAPWYASARVVALPTVEGTGVGIKTIEAMAAGVAIVATTLAYRGLPADWRKPAPPVDDADAFAEELIRLCLDRPAREGLRQDIRKAYAALDLENRYRRQMQTIEAHVLAAGMARLGKPTAALASVPDLARGAARLQEGPRPVSMRRADA